METKYATEKFNQKDETGQKKQIENLKHHLLFSLFHFHMSGGKKFIYCVYNKGERKILMFDS